VNAEFNVWLLIVGLVLGAGLVSLVIMDTRRREIEIDSVERPREAAWLSAVMIEDGFDVSPDAAEWMLELHRAYLEAPPPDPVAIDHDPPDDEGDPGDATDAFDGPDRVIPVDRTADDWDEPRPRTGV